MHMLTICISVLGLHTYQCHKLLLGGSRKQYRNILATTSVPRISQARPPRCFDVLFQRRFWYWAVELYSKQTLVQERVEQLSSVFARVSCGLSVSLRAQWIYVILLTLDPFWSWVTAVGGTKIPQDGTVFEQEHAWRWSGGGFGLDFDRPQYQDAAVEHYFRTSNTTLPYFFNGNYSTGGDYNRNGRGIPDIAASKNYCDRALANASFTDLKLLL